MTRDTLRNHLLDRLPPADAARVEPDLHHANLALGTPIYEQSEAIDRVYFPLSGVISLVTELQDGGGVEAATIGNEGMAGMSAALGGRRSLTRAVVQIGGEMLTMSRAAFEAHLLASPSLTGVVHGYINTMLATLAQNAACNAVHPVNSRCARWLLTTHDRVTGNEFPLTQEFLAQMLGVHRPTVSVAAGALQQAGLISYRRGRITVVDRAALEDAACECYAALRRSAPRNGHLD